MGALGPSGGFGRQGIREAITVLPVRFLGTDFVQVLFEPHHIFAARNYINFNSLRNPY
jgi:hypothetical protein